MRWRRAENEHKDEFNTGDKIVFKMDDGEWVNAVYMATTLHMDRQIFLVETEAWTDYEGVHHKARTIWHESAYRMHKGRLK